MRIYALEVGAAFMQGVVRSDVLLDNNSGSCVTDECGKSHLTEESCKSPGERLRRSEFSEDEEQGPHSGCRLRGFCEGMNAREGKERK